MGEFKKVTFNFRGEKTVRLIEKNQCKPISKARKRNENDAPSQQDKQKRSRVSNELLYREMKEMKKACQESHFESHKLLKAVNKTLSLSSNHLQPISLFLHQKAANADFYLPDKQNENLTSVKIKQEPKFFSNTDTDIIDLTISDDEETIERNNNAGSALSSVLSEKIKKEKFRDEQIFNKNKNESKIIIKDVLLEPQKFAVSTANKRPNTKHQKMFEIQPCHEQERFRCFGQLKDEKIPGLEISDKFGQLRYDMRKINPHIKKVNHAIKSKKSFENLTTTEALYSLFKCMAARCSYYTMKGENFLDHINEHVQNPYFASDFYLNCAYCAFVAKESDELVSHLEIYHAYCKYQCNQCFYRSAEAHNVLNHQESHHTSSSSKCKILVCPMLQNQEYPYLKIKRRFDELFKNTLICNVCEADFITPEELMDHLKTYEGGDKEIARTAKCQIYRILEDQSNIKVGKYQCFECTKTAYGTNFMREIRRHMQEHPRRFHYVAMRDSASRSIKLFKIPPKGVIHTVPYEGNIKRLYNSSNKLTINDDN